MDDLTRDLFLYENDDSDELEEDDLTEDDDAGLDEEGLDVEKSDMEDWELGEDSGEREGD